MKVEIEIVTGFLGSGKTKFINFIIEGGELAEETIVVIQDEFGESDINTVENKVIVVNNNLNDNIELSFILDIISKYSPDRIFIECNGMKSVNNIIDMFYEKLVRKTVSIDDIITLVDGKTFSMYLKNMGSYITDDIVNSKTVIINNSEDIKKDKLNKIIDDIENINENTNILKYDIDKGDYINIKKYKDKYSLRLLLVMLGLFAATFILSKVSLTPGGLKKVYIMFMSILIEGIPFILIGSFVSSIIQVCISREKMMRFIPKNIVVSCFVASLAGVFFPICDCGTIPVMRGLMKKGVSVATGITFMLAAPLVNPIAIISTIYAFPGRKSIVITRVLAGIIIAIIAGLIVNLITKKDEIIFKNKEDIVDCECGFCDSSYSDYTSLGVKVRGVFIHGGDEFFKVLKYMILGALISSVIQNVIITSNLNIPSGKLSSLLIMIAFAFIFSVCSTSDAFIAKGFLNQFSIGSVMGFLVVGPMLDVKNTIMLFGNFKKAFVVKLIVIIFVVSISVLMILT